MYPLSTKSQVSIGVVVILALGYWYNSSSNTLSRAYSALTSKKN